MFIVRLMSINLYPLSLWSRSCILTISFKKVSRIDNLEIWLAKSYNLVIFLYINKTHATYCKRHRKQISNNVDNLKIIYLCSVLQMMLPTTKLHLVLVHFNRIFITCVRFNSKGQCILPILFILWSEYK
jgi:hypothetical protein